MIKQILHRKLCNSTQQLYFISSQRDEMLHIYIYVCVCVSACVLIYFGISDKAITKWKH